MKAKGAILLLAIVAILLGAGLIYRNQEAEKQKTAYEARLTTQANDLRNTSQKWLEQTKVNTVLETDISTRTAEAQALSNRLETLANTLVKVEADAKAAAQAAAEAAQQEMAKRDARIGELEGERDQMTKQMTALNGEISQLEKQIGETERKLATSEGDREFLLKELKRLQAEKAELERQFNDLAILREQVKKLREELSISRRIEWIRRGLYGMESKGGERLNKGFPNIQSKTNYDLNVEIKQDGAARILPSPQPNAPVTPAPAPTPTPK